MSSLFERVELEKSLELEIWVIELEISRFGLWLYKCFHWAGINRLEPGGPICNVKLMTPSLKVLF